MPNGALLKQLFRNYKSSDNPGFEAVAQQIIAEERQKNHHMLANDLQRILANGSITVRRNGHFHPLPRNQEEDAGLLEIRHPDKYWSDLIITAENYTLLERVVTKVRRAEVLETYGVRPKSRLLFCARPAMVKR